MFQHIVSTKYPPSNKPMMVYDGNCSFCKFWVIRWKMMSNNKIEFQPYQKVLKIFSDIEEVHFKEAVRFVDIDGKVFSGPGAAYITYFNRGKVQFLFRWYQEVKWFRKLNDILYQWVAENRSFVFKICIKLIGANPRETKKYWVFYLLSLGILITVLSFWLTNI